MRGLRAATKGPRLAVALSIALLAATAGCAPVSDDALPAGVSVRLVQQRSDVAVHQAQVEIVNGTDVALTVEALTVSDPRFGADAERVLDRASHVAPGTTVGIRIQLPKPDCTAPDEGESTVHVTYETPGRSATATADLPDALSFLPGLHARECLASQLESAAAVSLTRFEADAGAASGTLILSVVPTGTGGASLLAIRPTNLLGFAGSDPDGSLPLDLALTPADTTARDVRIALEPFRCDPHAVQEDKRGTIFAMEVAVGDREGTIELVSPPALRADLLNWVAERCGFG